MPKVTKVGRLHIFAIAPRNVGNEVNFLPTNKYQNFLQIDIITFSVCSLPFPKYPKQQACNVLAISQGKREG